MQEKLLLDRAKDLRNGSTPFEAQLWRRISRSQLGGHKFRRQHVIDNCIVDFFCPANGLIVEIDGDTHDLMRDDQRDRRHASLGYSTIRFSNSDVGKNIDAVLGSLWEKLDSLPDRWPIATRLPHPLTPSPEGAGE
jgi:very-short-patch-repair endonuclease